MPPGRLYRPACIAALCLALLGCNREIGPTAPPLTVARMALDRRDIPYASEVLKKYLAGRPDDAEARFLFGQALLTVDDTAGAIVEYRRALDAGWSYAAVVPRLIVALVRRGRAQEAIRTYPLIDALDAAARADWALALATAWGQLGQVEPVRELAALALKESPASSAARLMQARLKAWDGDPQGALDQVEQVLKEHPADAEGLQLRAVLLRYWRNDLPAAIDSHRRVLALDPYHLPAHMGLMAALFAARDVPAMRQHGREMEKTIPASVHEWYALTQTEFLDGKYPRARELIQYTVNAAPEDPRFRGLAALIDLRLGDTLAAETSLAKMIGLAPTLAWPRRMLAHLREGRGQFAGALDAMFPLAAEPEVCAEHLGYAAEMALMAGDAKRADAMLRRLFDVQASGQTCRPPWTAAMLGLGLSTEDLPPLPVLAVRSPAAYRSMGTLAAALLAGDMATAGRALDRLQGEVPDDPLPQAVRVALKMPGKRPLVAGGRR